MAEFERKQQLPISKKVGELRGKVCKYVLLFARIQRIY
jgi:hypothetical protein